MKNGIEIHHIYKSYSKVTALNNISLEINPGELFGLIGPDGAGKTTLFRILTTLLLPDKGSATVCNLDIIKDLSEIRKRIGYMPGKFSLYQDLTVEENLKFFATVFNTSIEQNYDLIRNIYQQIEPFKSRRAGKLSGGMKQKLALCCALVHRPEVLFLDEPTTGVDPVSRSELWDMLFKLKEQGITILISTPYMDEASRCERIALMKEGKCLSVNTPQTIKDTFKYPIFSVKAANMFQLLKDLRTYPLTYTCFAFGDSHHLTLKHAGTMDELTSFLISKGHRDITIQSIEPSIEDCFMLI